MTDRATLDAVLARLLADALVRELREELRQEEDRARAASTRKDSRPREALARAAF